MDGVPALVLWREVLHTSNNVPPTEKIPTPNSKPRDCVRDNVHNIRLKREDDRNVDQLSNIDHVAHSSQCKAQLCIFEDNEAVIEMIIEVR